MTTKTNEKLNLETKSIAELQELFASTQQLLQQKQGEIRETAVQQIQQIALEAGIKVLIRLPKQKADSSLAKTYQHPEDSSLQWVAKQGAKPKWISDLLKNGHSLSDLEVKEQAA